MTEQPRQTASRAQRAFLAGAEAATRLGTGPGSDELLVQAAAEWDRADHSRTRRQGAARFKREHRRIGPVLSPDREAAYLKVLELRADGLSLSRIAAVMNGDQVPTPRGGTWGVSGVQAILASDAARRLAGGP